MSPEISQVLAQMRSISQQVSPAAATAAQPENGQSFSQALADSINWVNQNQSIARELSNAFERGDEATSLADVMVAAQKASLSFEAVSQVRNKLLSAYQDVMNMPV